MTIEINTKLPKSEKPKDQATNQDQTGDKKPEKKTYEFQLPASLLE